jgi:TonB family protein
MSVLAMPSSGIGVGGGIGSGTGGGVGRGRGPGVGAGRGGGIGGGVYRVGGGVSAPRLVHSPDPQYSEEARKANVQGTVILWALIRTDGRPTDLRVVRSLGMGLDEKALEAVREWRFDPAMKDGTPVSVQVNIEVNFRPEGAFTTVTAAGERVAKGEQAAQSRLLDSKLHPQLVAAYDCWQTQADKSRAARACKLDNERLLVKVVISGDVPTALRQLQAIGFEHHPAEQRRDQYLGRIAVERLAALAAVQQVQFAAPATAP